MKFRILLLILVNTLLQAPISAQLTIGSATEPLSGVLLDIKNTSDGNSDKGLLLPRVLLKNRNSLNPLLTESGATNADSLAYHRGLTVYNLTKSDNLCPGVYTWNGQSWVELNSMPENVYKGDTESNSFIVPINTIIDIPVEKAYRFWAEYKTPPLAIERFPNKKLSSRYPGVVKAVLLWEDSPGLIANASPINNNLYVLNNAEKGKEPAIIGEGQDAYIRVEPRYNKCDTIGGNALIALTIDGIVYWSWHIWYTNYNPNQIIDTLSFGAYRVEQGEIYEYDNQLSDKTTIFMDRNLGALSSAPGDKRSIGLLYQWGRKDPYPGIADFNFLAPQNNIYDAKNGDTPINKNIIKQFPGDILNLPNAINYPMTIYLHDRSDVFNDWYSSVSASSGLAVRHHNLLCQNNYLWDYQGQKTYFDPCPKGWRVPDIRVWTNPRAFSVGSASNPLSYGGTFNNGWIFNDPHYNIGYYPATSNTGAQTGFYHTNNVPHYYIGGAEDLSKCDLFVLDKNQLSISSKNSYRTGSNRETLGALRCVQE